MSDVLIVGAGVIGLAVARALAGAGAQVTVLDAGEPGQAATAASAGVLCPAAPAEWDGPLGAFNVAAAERWPAWAEEVAADGATGRGPAPWFERRGELRVGPAAEDGGPYVTAALAGARAAGWPVEAVDAAAVAALEPAVGATGLAGVHLPATASVDTAALTAALLAACARLDVTVRGHTRIDAIDGVRRVIDAGGDEHPFDRLVVATGFAPPGLGPALRCGIRPLLGERLLTRPDPAHPCNTTIVRSAGGPLVPRADGTLWVGVTALDRGHQALPTVGSTLAIAERATRLVPAVAHASLLDVRSGLRPVSDDGAPLLGPVGDGIVAALGHGRAGVLQAPLTADLIVGGVRSNHWDTIPHALRAAA